MIVNKHGFSYRLNSYRCMIFRKIRFIFWPSFIKILIKLFAGSAYLLKNIKEYGEKILIILFCKMTNLQISVLSIVKVEKISRDQLYFILLREESLIYYLTSEAGVVQILPLKQYDFSLFFVS